MLLRGCIVLIKVRVVGDDIYCGGSGRNKKSSCGGCSGCGSLSGFYWKFSDVVAQDLKTVFYDDEVFINKINNLSGGCL
ncbi:MAG: hypothetical protein GY861_22380 [bacterium]|nr:hypothetical protein [bacterium]